MKIKTKQNLMEIVKRNKMEKNVKKINRLIKKL